MNPQPNPTPNTLHLYGNIVDVFAGRTNPANLTPERAGVSPALRFGLGVSSFANDPENIGDAVTLDRRFFVRSTDEGERRDPRRALYKEGRARSYRTVYSLGITEHPLDLREKRFLSDPACPPGTTVESLIANVIGPARSPGTSPRTYGFLGLLDYENLHATSLAVPPIHGENIIPLMPKYARPSDSLPNLSGVVMGFVRDRVDEHDSAENQTLGQRLFFDNPKDRDDETIQGPHWISHTHGVRLRPGDSVLPADAADLERMATKEVFCRKTVARAVGRADYGDCGHVIPRSTLRRYFLIAFPIHAIETFNSGSLV